MKETLLYVCKRWRIQFAMAVIAVFMLVSPAHAQQLTNLPTVYITTDDGLDPWSKTIYQSGKIIIKSSDPTEELDMVTEIRGRGNSTWGAAKKPYKLKLNKKYNLLNNTAKAKKWVLLANDFDKTLIRNAVASKISELTGFEFSPSVRFVDVVLNGNYVGNYMLTDQMEVNPNRVPIEEQDGSYLVEVDGFASSEPQWFKTGKNMPVTIHYPGSEEITTAQYNYISQFTQQFENALFASNFTNPTSGYKAFVDTVSLVNWYVASELTGNPDAFWSTYMYKYHNDNKFYFGPLWDFDIAFNNDSRLGDATRKLMREHAHEPKTWIKQIWKDDWFKRAVNKRWQELLNEDILNKIIDYIDETATIIAASQKLNESKWHKGGNYSTEINNLRTYIRNRVDFLTTRFAADEPPMPSQTFVPEDYYYMLMNVATNNVIEVSDTALGEKAPLYMMNPKEEDCAAQRWIFKPIDSNVTLGNDYYQIFNAHSGMTIAGNGKEKNLIQVLPDWTDYAQIWQVVPVLTGNLYGLVNLKSSYSIDNKGGSASETTPVIEYPNNITGNANQQWYLKKMEAITDLPGYPEPEISAVSAVSACPFTVAYLPASKSIRITGISSSAKDLKVSLYSIDGQRICDKSFKQEYRIEIPLSGISAQTGIYILNINGYASKLIIK